MIISSDRSSYATIFSYAVKGRQITPRYSTLILGMVTIMMSVRVLVRICVLIMVMVSAYKGYGEILRKLWGKTEFIIC